MKFHNNVNKWFRSQSGSGARRSRSRAKKERWIEARLPAKNNVNYSSQVLLDEALRIKSQLRDRGDAFVPRCLSMLKAVIKLGGVPSASTDDIWNSQIACYELAVLLSQLQKDKEADKYLSKLGFRYKLSSQVFGPTRRSDADSHPDSRKDRRSDENRPGYGFARAVDGAIPQSLLRQLQHNFAPTAAFWNDHGYPTPGFFSYNCLRGQGGLLDHLVSSYLLPLAAQSFPHLDLENTIHSFEWWSHRRDDVTSGGAHQMHFDLDESTLRVKRKAKSPLVSIVVYLTGHSDYSAPTLVTDQELSSSSVATQGWQCYPKVGRVLMFDGRLLHGVVPYLNAPGCLASSEVHADANARTTLMLGLWDQGVMTSTLKRRGRSALTANMRPSYALSGPNYATQMEKCNVTEAMLQRVSPIWRSVRGSGAQKDTEEAKDREEAKESPSSNSNQPISGVTTVNIAELLAEQAAQEQQTQSEAKPPENVQFFGRWFLRDLSDIYSEIMN